VLFFPLKIFVNFISIDASPFILGDGVLCVLRVGHFGAGWGSECAAVVFVVGGFGHHVVVSKGI